MSLCKVLCVLTRKVTISFPLVASWFSNHFKPSEAELCVGSFQNSSVV